MKTLEAFREAEGMDPWRPYTIELTNNDGLSVDRQGVVTWDELDSEYVRFSLSDGGVMLIAVDAVVALNIKAARR